MEAFFQTALCTRSPSADATAGYTVAENATAASAHSFDNIAYDEEFPAEHYAQVQWTDAFFNPLTQE